MDICFVDTSDLSGSRCNTISDEAAKEEAALLLPVPNLLQIIRQIKNQKELAKELGKPTTYQKTSNQRVFVVPT